MAGEIQLNGTTALTESSGAITLNNVNSETNRANLGMGGFTGMIASFAMSSAPTGWLVCNGAEYAIATYGDLYTAIGTTWGALTNGSGGAGSTHFVVPDLRGCFLRGTGQHATLTTSNRSIAQTQNSKGSTLRVHGFAGETAAILYNSSADITTGSGEQGFATGFWSGSDTVYSRAGLEIRTDETYPTNTAINYCIKY